MAEQAATEAAQAAAAAQAAMMAQMAQLIIKMGEAATARDEADRKRDERDQAEAERRKELDELRAQADIKRREEDAVARKEREERDSEPRVANPEKFTGKAEELNTFLFHVNNVFSLQPHRYKKEAVKVSWMLLFLGGVPAQAVEGKVTAAGGIEKVEEFSSVEKVTAWLKSSYGDIDAENTAREKIRCLKQGDSSASAYLIELQRLAAGLNWGDARMIEEGEKGLSPRLRKVKAEQGISHTSFTEFMSWIVGLDNRLSQVESREKREREERMKDAAWKEKDEKKGGQMVKRETVEKVKVEVVEQGGVKQGLGSGGSQREQGQGGMSQDVRAYRSANGLCFSCGLSGHPISQCPTKTSPSNPSTTWSRPNTTTIPVKEEKEAGKERA